MNEFSTKAEARAAARQILSLIKNKAERDDFLCDAFLNCDEYKSCEILLAYAGIGSEINTVSIIETTISSGKAVYLPVCDTGREVMEFYRVFSLKELKSGAYDIPEPIISPDNLYSGEAALCLVPGLAFAANGKRLGKGKGYYDKFLSINSVKTAAMCYNELVFHDIPTEITDITIQKIITDKKG